jgi:hypothetical protein
MQYFSPGGHPPGLLEGIIGIKIKDLFRKSICHVAACGGAAARGYMN